MNDFLDSYTPNSVGWWDFQQFFEDNIRAVEGIGFDTMDRARDLAGYVSIIAFEEYPPCEVQDAIQELRAFINSLPRV